MAKTKHGLSKSRIYRVWAGMRKRCENQRSLPYRDYGGRGIKVCAEWQEFEKFYRDMGDCPDGLSIDRINNDGDYEPGNCRWADRKTQARNKRHNTKITGFGKTMTVSEWSEKTGISAKAILNRISRGLTGEKAVENIPGSEFAQSMAALRWANKTPSERSAHAHLMLAGRRAKRAAKKLAESP